VSWADVNLNEDPVDALSKRITDLEDTITTQFEQLLNELATIRKSLADVVAEPARELQPRVSGGNDIEVVAAKLQHAVLLALSTFEQSVTANGTSSDRPATATDIARLSSRIDELRTLLLG
jgi:hypothetical protein